jgi:hypothetical protein
VLGGNVIDLGDVKEITLNVLGYLLHHGPSFAPEALHLSEVVLVPDPFARVALVQIRLSNIVLVALDAHATNVRTKIGYAAATAIVAAS